MSCMLHSSWPTPASEYIPDQLWCCEARWFWHCPCSEQHSGVGQDMYRHTLLPLPWDMWEQALQQQEVRGLPREEEKWVPVSPSTVTFGPWAVSCTSWPPSSMQWVLHHEQGLLSCCIHTYFIASVWSRQHAQSCPQDHQALLFHWWSHCYFIVVLLHRGRYPPVSTRYSKALRNLIDSCLKHSPRDRPSITTILKMPFIQKRIEQFLSEAVSKYTCTCTTYYCVDGKFLDIIFDRVSSIYKIKYVSARSF